MLKDSYRGKRVILCLFARSGCKSRCSIPFYVMLSELSEHGLALPCVRWKPSSTDEKPTKIATWRKKKNQTECISDGIRKQESGTKQGVLCQCCFSHTVGYRSSWKILTIARFTQAVASWVRVASSSCSCIFFSSLLQVQKWEWCNRKTRHLLWFFKIQTKSCRLLSLGLPPQWHNSHSKLVVRHKHFTEAICERPLFDFLNERTNPGLEIQTTFCCRWG